MQLLANAVEPPLQDIGAAGVALGGKQLVHVAHRDAELPRDVLRRQVDVGKIPVDFSEYGAAQLIGSRNEGCRLGGCVRVAAIELEGEQCQARVVDISQFVARSGVQAAWRVAPDSSRTACAS